MDQGSPVERLRAALLDLVLPTPCAGCGDETTRWCAACAGRFARPRLRWVEGLPPVVALAPYAGPPRAAVLAYKERGRRDLATPLAAGVAAALTGPLLRGVGPRCLLVPAPSRASAARARGGDHMVRLARAVAARPGGHGAGAGPRVVRALALSAGARDSVGLDAAARAQNLARHLRLRPAGLRAARLAGAPPPAVLLDDVLTTGATARACAALLARAGLPVGAVVVLTAVGRG